MTQPPIIAYGSNMPMGDLSPEHLVDQALNLLAERAGPVLARSRMFRTPAFPEGSGPDFVNGAFTLDTVLTPEELLAEMHNLEEKMGRRRQLRWGARTLDLDLIGWGARVLPDAERQSLWRDLAPEAQQQEAPDRLILPHPRVQDRGFVLIPMLDIVPDWRHPLTGLTVAEMVAALPAAERDSVVPLG